MQRTRTRWLALWLALALASVLPLAGQAAEDDEAPAEEQAEEAEPAEEKPAAAEEDEADAEPADEELEEEEADWSPTHRGLYLIGQGGYAFMLTPSDLESDAKNAAGISNVNSHVDDSWGYGGRVGWRLMERVALEGQFEYLNEISINQHTQSGNNARSEATFLTATGNVKGYLLTERFQPYVLGGLGYGHGEIDPSGSGTRDRSHGFVARLGVGTDLYITDSVGVMTELAYVLPTGDIDSYHNLVIGFGIVLRIQGGD